MSCNQIEQWTKIDSASKAFKTDRNFCWETWSRSYQRGFVLTHIESEKHEDDQFSTNSDMEVCKNTFKIHKFVRLKFSGTNNLLKICPIFGIQLIVFGNAEN